MEPSSGLDKAINKSQNLFPHLDQNVGYDLKSVCFAFVLQIVLDCKPKTQEIKSVDIRYQNNIAEITRLSTSKLAKTMDGQFGHTLFKSYAGYNQKIGNTLGRKNFLIECLTH